jgi:hypothetical protein
MTACLVLAGVMLAVEIRIYETEPGTRSEFHRLVETKAVPMLRESGVDVVAFGASEHDERSYYLVRAYPDLDSRRASQDAFYGSKAWQDGPRASILALISSFTTTVVLLDHVAVDQLRSAPAAAVDTER